jgi:hypothetical protein
MTQLTPFPTLAVEDIGLDREGRVTITNLQITRRLHAATMTSKSKPKPNTNCTCNNSKDCGSKGNVTGCHTNSYPQCGCIVK